MNKKYVLSFILFLILFILVVGSTYAVISYSNISSSINTISTNQVSMSFIEPSNTITINNALPEYDSFGKTSSNYFEFDISAYANTLSTDDTGYNISYSIILRKVSVDSGKTALSDSNIKIYLTRIENNNEKVVLSPTKVSSLSAFGSNKLIYSYGFNFNKGDTSKTSKYRLRFWVSDDTDSSSWSSTSLYQYKFKVDISGEGVKANNILPNEYQQVEYISSSGSQYIDTGFKGNTTTTRFVGSFMPTGNNNYNGLFGARNVSGSIGDGSLNAFLTYSGSNTFIRADWTLVNSAMTSLISSPLNNIVTIDMSRPKAIINNKTYNGSNTISVNINYSFYIGNINSVNTTYQYGFIGRIYPCKIYDKNILVRNLVPCYRKSDNVIGMYDTVNGVFYTNKGTGTFAKGNNI